MKTNVLLTGIFAVVLLSACSKEDSNIVSPVFTKGKSAVNVQSVRVGDWAQYQRYTLDVNNDVEASSKTTFSRTVLSTNEYISGKSGVTKVVDSIFGAKGEFLRTEINYYKVENGTLSSYNFAKKVNQHLGFVMEYEWAEFNLIGRTSSGTTGSLMNGNITLLPSGYASPILMSGEFKGKNYVYPTNRNLSYNCYINNWTIDKTQLGTDADIPVEFAIGGTDADIPVEFVIGGTDADIPVEFVIVKEKISTVTMNNTVIPGTQYELIGYKRAQ